MGKASTRAGSRTPPPLIGRSTVEAIGSGLYWGAAGAVANLAQRMQQALGHDCELFLTGGGAVWKDVLPDARYVPDLTLIGVALIGRSLPRPGGPP